MKRYLKKIEETYRKEGITSVLIKTYFNIRNPIIRKILLYDKENIIKWENLKNKYRGKRVFLIGNGASLNKTPLYYLKNEYTMCFNRFTIMLNRINWKPSFYMVDDDIVLEDMIDEVKNLIPHTNISFFPDIHRKGHIFKNKIKGFQNVLWLYHTFGEFSKKLPWVAPGNTVAYTALQVLLHLGFDEIMLVGVDMNYRIHKSVRMLDNEENIESLKDDDPNHFDPRYFGKGRKYHQPLQSTIDNIFKSMNKVATSISGTNTKIYNAGYDSFLKSFQKVEFESLFNFSEIEKLILFEESLQKNSKYKTLASFLANSTFLKNIDIIENFEELGNFYTDSNNGLKIIPKIIFSHIPFGPFNNQYYFVREQKSYKYG